MALYDCDEWRKEKTINPKSLRNIKEDGPMYKKIQRYCDEKVEQVHCDDWLSDRTKNPKTKRRISKDGDIYKLFQSRCEGGDVRIQSTDDDDDYDALCKKWRRDKTVNPKTGNDIKEYGNVYKRWNRECTGKVSQAECDNWSKNPTKNPQNNRRIVKDGDIYKFFKRKCSPNNSNNVRVLVSGDGMSPQQQQQQQQQQQVVPQVAPAAYEFSIDDDVFIQQPTRIVAPAAQVKRGKPVFDFDSILDDLSLTSRIVDAARFDKAFKKINLRQGQMCMTASKSLYNKLNDVKPLGQGGFGVVYTASLPNTAPFVIKDAYLMPDEVARLRKYMKDTNRVIRVADYPTEYRISCLIRDLIKTNKCHNYSYVYNFALCKSCNIKPINDDEEDVYKMGSSQCAVTFMEAAHGDIYSLQKFENLRFDEETAWSILYQLLMALQAMHSTYGIYHHDIKLDNILVKSVEPRGYFEYKVENDLLNDTFYVKNMGYLVLLSDFGISQTFNGDNVNRNIAHDRGTRNAKVVSKHGKLVFEPIVFAEKARVKREFAKTYIDTSLNDDFCYWKENITSTMNQVYSMNNIIYPDVSQRIDLDDFVRYPPFELFNDIMNVMHMFSGGEIMTIPEKCHVRVTGASDEMVRKINNLGVVNRKIPQYSTTDTVKLIVAREMLKYMQRDSDKKLRVANDQIFHSCTCK